MTKKSDRIALFISVLLHSLLVFFPREEDPLLSAASSTPTESISVVELPTPSISEFQALPADPPAPEVPATPPAAVVPPASTVATPSVSASAPPKSPSTEASDTPIEEPEPDPEAGLSPEDPNIETSDTPVEEPTSATAFDADLPPEDPSPETTDSPIDEPAPDPETDLSPEGPSPETTDSSIDEAKIAADWENWVGHLQSQNQEQGFESFLLLDIFNFFGEPDQVQQFFDENNQPKIEVSSFYLFPELTPEQVLQTVVIPELTSTGFELRPQENVSVGLAYQLSQGEMLRYLLIVRLNERSGSVLMLSDSLLGLES